MKNLEFHLQKTIVIVFVILFCKAGYSQFPQIFFGSQGFTVITDVHISSSPLTNYYNSETNTNFYTSYQHLQINFFHFHLGGRMNVLHLGESSSFSLRTKPSLGGGVAYQIFDGGTWYSLGASLPLIFEFNYGRGAQYNSPNNRGFFIGAGAEYSVYPLVGYAISETSLSAKEFRKNWISMLFTVGYRHINEKNVTKEINFSFGIGKDAKEFITFGGDLEKEKQPFSVKVSFSRIFM